MRIAVLQGGRSAEREVSLRSGAQVAAALRGRRHDVEQVDLDRDVWDRLRDGGFDCVFIALHGRLGEDGTVQGMLELLGLPYIGSGVLASALCIDKAKTNRLLQAEGFAVPDFEEVAGDDAERLAARYGLPAVVKPVREGSTIGLTIAADVDALASGLVLARRYDARVLVQRFVSGTEVTVGVLGDRALAAMEVVPLGDEMHTYEVKYTPGREKFVLPAPLGAGYRAVLDLALETHRVLQAGPYSRVDLRVRPNGEALVLECNTLPGLHELGWFPAMAKHAGIPFVDLIETILDRAALNVNETVLGAKR